ncbi:hypothetical protein Btru_026884 [Bulinus truncatus]|nr:hypothetical protein Btru_026884 [Bulinus truncatus]
MISCKGLAKLLGKKDGDIPVVAPPPERLAPYQYDLSSIRNLKHERKLMQEDRGVLDSDRPIDYLFETGGNIGERFLDPDTRMLDLYKVNPEATYVVRMPSTSTMNHLMSLPRHQAVVNLTLRRLLSNAACSPVPPTPGHPAKVQPPETFINTSDDSESLSRTQASRVWKSLQIVNSTFNQVQNGSRANLISDHTEQDKNPPSQAVIRLKESLLAHETSHLNNCITEEFKKDKLSPLGPWTQCLREFHSTISVGRRPAPLIPYTPPSNTLGLTYISDLNEEDAERVKNVAYEELKNLLTSHNIQFTKVSPRKRTSVHGVFGSSLEALVQKDIKRNRLLTDMKVPAVFLMMVRFIEENGLESEGIFRLSGSSDRVKRLRQDLESNFYSNPKYSLYEVPDLTVHDVASTFKAFLRELPASLVSSGEWKFSQIFPVRPATKEQIKLTNMFILSMKEEYRDTLQVFLRLVASIIERKSVTKMEDSNLATCLTQTYLRCPSLVNRVQNMNCSPPEFLSQIRQQYATGASVKPKRKFPIPGQSIPGSVYSRVSLFQGQSIPESVYSRVSLFQSQSIPESVHSRVGPIPEPISAETQQ